jgi:hypothetical protein
MTTTIKKVSLCTTEIECKGCGTKWFKKLNNVISLTCLTWTILPISCITYHEYLHAN